MPTEVISFGFMIGFIAADVITGFAKAKITKTYKSSIQRLGLYHKAGEIGLVLLFYAVGLYMHYTMPESNLVEMFKLTECSSLYIIINEIGSIKENLVTIKDYNPTKDKSKKK